MFFDLLCFDFMELIFFFIFCFNFCLMLRKAKVKKLLCFHDIVYSEC